MPRSAKTTAKIAGMAHKTSPRSLGTARLVSLLRQRMKETGMAQTKVATEIGIDPTLPSKLFQNEFRNVDQKTIDCVVATFGIEPRFFNEAALGPNPDYRSYMARRPRQKSVAKAHDGGASAADLESLPPEIAEQLEMLAASPEERDAFIDIIQVYNFPFVNRSLVLGIISGIRKGKRMPRSIDDALAASIDEEAKKRKPPDDNE